MSITPPVRLAAGLSLLLIGLGAARLLWLDTLLQQQVEAVESRTAERDQLQQDIVAANEELSVLEHIGTRFRQLDEARTFQPQDRLDLAEWMDRQTALLAITGARYTFKPVEESRIPVGTVTLIQRTVPVDLTLDGADDLAMLDFARLASLQRQGLLRVEELVLERVEQGQGRWVEQARNGAVPAAVRARIRLAWARLAPPSSGGTP